VEVLSSFFSASLSCTLDDVSAEVNLRDVEEADLEVFLAQEQDPEAARRANFAPRDREAFVDHWTHKILGDPDVRAQTVTRNGATAGNLVAWWQADRRYIGYWLGREYWGRGVATQALSLFLRRESTRPLWADTDIGNAASIRLLRRCGFSEVETITEGDVQYVLLALR
jgi:RimJ/RimL family protein N-acetyltransferase